ncbi:UNVERIFIED_CONTAM: Auxin response factor 17 [Sesamum calycinum]|uniref:Auxin response factor n=1 Tax=Sesamum calycinum TaxID=2727403 RepID=A0AAW2P8Q9_9LAMI
MESGRRRLLPDSISQLLRLLLPARPLGTALLRLRRESECRTQTTVHSLPSPLRPFAFKPFLRPSFRQTPTTPALHAWEKRLNCSTTGDRNENDVVSFAKVLTPSDANNGGGFSVPRFCADSIFPPLDFGSDPPVQNLIMKDTHNNAWEFRHIYRGTPRRHLLTTGWSKFVNAKRLIAGDSVVFMRKKSTNELFTGIRRAGPFGSSCWDGGKTSADSSMSVVVEAIKNSDQGIAFEVVHYPRFGSPDFVVSAEKVEDALRICWSAGMRVKMAVETEDSSRMTWFQGTVAATVLPGSGPWCGSPWRMLQARISLVWPNQIRARIFPDLDRPNLNHICHVISVQYSESDQSSVIGLVQPNLGKFLPRLGSAKLDPITYTCNVIGVQYRESDQSSVI